MATSDPNLKVNLSGPLPQEALRVETCSVRGVDLELSFALATGQELELELVHPILGAPLVLPARTAWCRIEPGQSQPRAGLEFASMAPEQRRDIRRIQAAAISCRVVSGRRTAGFVAVQGPDQWAVYDADTVKVAALTRRGRGFEAAFLGKSPEASIHTLTVDSLPEAVAEVLQLDGTPLVVPPECGPWHPAGPPQPAGPPPRAVKRPAPGQGRPAAAPAAGSASSRAAEATSAYHTVRAGGLLVGYLAVTSVDESWSLFDGDWREVAIVSPDREGRYRVQMVEPGGAGSPDTIVASSSLGAVQLAYRLRAEPELDPPLPGSSGLGREPGPSSSSVARAAGRAQSFGPDRLEQDTPSHGVLDAGGSLVGYVTRTPGLDNVWNVYTPEGGKLALVALEEGRFKILYMGDRPGDSLEYLLARTFSGALAIVFELVAPPLLDPPLPGVGE